MHPIFIYLGQKPIYWFGVMMAAAFLAGIIHLQFLGRREGRDPAFGADLAFWIMIGGIAGARATYVLASFDYYLAHPGAILRVDQGGLVFYGGLIGAMLALAVFARRRRERLLSVLDMVATAVPLGHALGRVGCFLNGCCYGQPGPASWCVALPAVDALPRHPVQLYEAAANLALYGVLLAAYRRRRTPGGITALYLTIYPVARFLFEFLRGDERLRFAGLTLAQISSIALFLAGMGLWAWVRRSHDTAHG